MFSKIHILLVFLRMEKQQKNLLKMRVRHSLVVDVLAGTVELDLARLIWSRFGRSFANLRQPQVGA